MQEIDIYRSANLLIQKYDGEAMAIAQKRSQSFQEQGDIAGADAWFRIAQAVKWLQTKDYPSEAIVAH